jgi:hypothetical protein
MYIIYNYLASDDLLVSVHRLIIQKADVKDIPVVSIQRFSVNCKTDVVPGIVQIICTHWCRVLHQFQEYYPRNTILTANKPNEVYNDLCVCKLPFSTKLKFGCSYQLSLSDNSIINYTAPRSKNGSFRKAIMMQNFQATDLCFQVRSDGGDSVEGVEVGICESAGNGYSFSKSGDDPHHSAEGGDSTASRIGSLLQTPSSSSSACNGKDTRLRQSELKLDGEVRALVSEE